jgi:hypothetical protein
MKYRFDHVATAEAALCILKLYGVTASRGGVELLVDDRHVYDRTSKASVILRLYDAKHVPY